MGAGSSRGAGKGLSKERLRAEICVKLHLAIGGDATARSGHRVTLEQAFASADTDGDGTVDFREVRLAALASRLPPLGPRLS